MNLSNADETLERAASDMTVGRPFQMRASDEFWRGVDDWRRLQPDMPNRAEAVRRFLVANFGIDQKRLVARGFGFAHPKNGGAPLSPENRRVQIVNLSKDERR